MFGNQRNPDGTRPHFRPRACPRDNTPLTPTKIGHVTVDKCGTCQGLWLDKNEILKLTGDRELNHFLRDEVGAEADSPLICVNCGGLMDTENVPGVDVNVAVCYDCLGIWLDAGELELLRKRKHERINLTPEKADHLRATLRTEYGERLGFFAHVLDVLDRHLPG